MSNLLVANEFITYQKSTPLFNAMVGIIDGFQKQLRFKTRFINNSKLPDIIMKYTGLKAKFDDFDMDDENAFMVVPDINKNNVLYDELLQEYFENTDFDKIREKNETLMGSVDIANSKVEGIFSKIETTIGLGNAYWKTKGTYTFTPQEVAAIILHELGHLFTIFLFLVETVRTNMVLSALNRSDFFKSSPEKKITLLNDLENDLNITIEDKETLSISDDQVVYTVLITSLIKTPRSELNTPTYDERTCEFVADQFATMHGAGVDLVTGLHKSYKRYDMVYDKRENYIKISLHYLFSLLLGYGITYTIAYFLKAVVFVIIFQIMYLLLYIYIKETMPELYDPLAVRFNKIKEQLVGILKDRTLPKAVRKNIINDIETIDEYAKFTGEYKSIYHFIYKIVIPWSNKRKKVAELQHEYESLANNPFYTASAKMSL